MTRSRTLILASLYCLAGGLATGVAAQESVITVREDGILVPQSDGAQLGMLLLTAHGPAWGYVAQDRGQVALGAAREPGVWAFTGEMVVPGTDGGIVQFEQSVALAGEGATVEYDIRFSKPMALKGLQASLRFPAAPFAGRTVAVMLADGSVHEVELPEEVGADRPQLLRLALQPEDEPGEPEQPEGESQEPEQSPIVDVDGKVLLTIDEAAGLMVQDLRPYGPDQYEVRILAIADQKGHMVTADDEYSIKFTVSLPGEMTLVGP